MKKIFSFLFVVIMAIGVNAGNDNKDVTEAPYKVGDYYNDGTKEGVVFVVSDDGMHGKIVSLGECKVMWSNQRPMNKTVGAKSADNGMSNMNKVKEQADWETFFPAFVWCASMGEGWYLPAKDEMDLIAQNRNVISGRLNEKGYGVILNEEYWTSTEIDSSCAWLVRLNGGRSGNYFKNRVGCVRAVSAF